MAFLSIAGTEGFGGLTTAFGSKVPVVSSGSIMPSVSSDTSSSCLGSVDSLRWRSLAKFSRGVGSSCLSSHAAEHSGRESAGLEVSSMAVGSFWRYGKQEDVGVTSVTFWDATGILGSSKSMRAGIWVCSCWGLAEYLLFFLGIMVSVKMALLADLLNRL